MRLQRVAHRPPVVAGCLQHDDFHVPLPQPVQQAADLGRGRLEPFGLQRPHPGALLIRCPHARQQKPLAQIQTSRPKIDGLVLNIPLHQILLYLEFP